MLEKLDKFNPLHIAWINNTWNYCIRIVICSWKGHDLLGRMCFRCWKWHGPDKYDWSE